MAASLLTSHAGRVRVPVCPPEVVYKDECAYSFESPDCEDGLYISMVSFLGFGRRFVEGYFNKTGNAVFLRYRRVKHEIVKSEQEDAETKKPTRLAIGVEGGFSLGGEKKYDIEDVFTVIVMPNWVELPLSSPEIPEQIHNSAAAIIAADSAAKQAELAALAGTWDGEQRLISKHAEDLVQLDNGRKIAPTGWKCERCDKTDNLWLNLTDGTILCGRKFWDGTGGNNHAVEYYNETKYPLAVKLGTITPEGGDVYSYAEDDMMLDPQLSKHLAHFGIDIMTMEKTDKTMIEMELDLNQRTTEWSILTESSGNPLQPVYGPGYTGIHNLGNSCYINSTMQLLFHLPPFLKRFYSDGEAQRLFETNWIDPYADFNIQMAKFAHGLSSGDYSKQPIDSGTSTAGVELGIRPLMFKSLIGRGHKEFSTKRQQDAHEFLLHMFSSIERNNVSGGWARDSRSPTDSVRFCVEDRIECTESRHVRYMSHEDYCLALRIPLEAATNKDEVEASRLLKESSMDTNQSAQIEVVRPRISLNACFEAFASDSYVDDFYSAALKKKTTAKKSVRLSTFPDYLFLHMEKFTVGADWVERKLDISLDMPDIIDISHLRGRGVQPGEELLPEDEPIAASGGSSAAVAPEAVIDELLVTQLMDMGFGLEGCKKAVYYTASSGGGIEAAMNWVMEHMEDPDFADPFIPPRSTTTGRAQESEFMADSASLDMIMSLGFTRSQATRALKATDNNVERAADWIFSHAGELDQPEDTGTPAAPTVGSQPSGTATGGQPSTTQRCADGPGKYRLMAFISHMGTSTKAGHYVCHIRKDDRWIIFNDEKVALSEHPPKEYGYIYVYGRI